MFGACLHAKIGLLNGVNIQRRKGSKFGAESHRTYRVSATHVSPAILTSIIVLDTLATFWNVP